MTKFIVESRTEHGSISLRCEAGDGRLIILDEGSGLPDIIVQGFQPSMDIFYRSPEPLSPQVLAEEVTIHVPQSLHQIPQGRLALSSLGGLVLMQYVHPAFSAISPFAALSEFIRASGDVNYGILQADNGGLLFVHRAGADMQVYVSAHSLKTFLELPGDERESVFPSIHAMELLVSGSDLDHFEHLALDPITRARKISIDDFEPLCEFTSNMSERIVFNPHLYTLAIGGARVYATIGGWL